MTTETKSILLQCYGCGRSGGYDFFDIPPQCPKCGSYEVNLPEAGENWKIHTYRPNLAEGPITRSGGELMRRLPDQFHTYEVGRICSLLVRYGNQGFRLGEEECNGPAWLESLDRQIGKAYREGEKVSHAALVEMYSRKMANWQTDLALRFHQCETRLEILAGELSRITGETWTISSSSLSYLLVIPPTFYATTRDNATAYRGSENLRALYLGDA